MHNGSAVKFGTIFSGNYTLLKRPYFKDGYSFPNDAPPWASTLFLRAAYLSNIIMGAGVKG